MADLQLMKNDLMAVKDLRVIGMLGNIDVPSSRMVVAGEQVEGRREQLPVPTLGGTVRVREVARENAQPIEVTLQPGADVDFPQDGRHRPPHRRDPDEGGPPMHQLLARTRADQPLARSPHPAQSQDEGAPLLE